jgi:hypothetical protein
MRVIADIVSLTPDDFSLYRQTLFQFVSQFIVYTRLEFEDLNGAAWIHTIFDGSFKN